MKWKVKLGRDEYEDRVREPALRASQVRIFGDFAVYQSSGFYRKEDDNTEIQGLGFYLNCQFVCLLTDGQHSFNI